MTSANQALLYGALKLTVPLWFARLKHEPYAVLTDRLTECYEKLADDKGTKSLLTHNGYDLRLFNKAAEAIAIGLLLKAKPITFQGMTFELPLEP